MFAQRITGPTGLCFQAIGHMLNGVITIRGHRLGRKTLEQWLVVDVSFHGNKRLNTLLAAHLTFSALK